MPRELTTEERERLAAIARQLERADQEQLMTDAVIATTQDADLKLLAVVEQRLADLYGHRGFYATKGATILGFVAQRDALRERLGEAADRVPRLSEQAAANARQAAQLRERLLEVTQELVHLDGQSNPRVFALRVERDSLRAQLKEIEG